MRDPKFDPSLSVIAWDGDKIAGGVINEINSTENAALAVSVAGCGASSCGAVAATRAGQGDRAPIAGGLPRARHDQRRAWAWTPTTRPGAMGLYTGTGFETEVRSSAYRKPMETAA